jgi:hypothetical protein
MNRLSSEPALTPMRIGVWVPDPGSPGFVPQPPKFPLDLGSIVRLAPGALGPPGYLELVPHSGVWVPDPRAPR